MSALEKRLYTLLERYGISLAARDTRFFASAFKIYEYQELLAGAGLNAEQHVLDLGCGFGRQSQLIARHVKSVLGLDVSDKRITAARQLLRFSPVKERVQYLNSPLENAALAAQSFERILSFCVLEHIPNLPDVLREAHRILKPSGEIHVTVDSLGSIQDGALIEKHRRDHAVVQYFTLDTLRQALESAGFDVFELRAIMKGPLAQREFEHRIREGSRRSIFERMSFADSLRTEDRQTDGDAGLMVLARARK